MKVIVLLFSLLFFQSQKVVVLNKKTAEPIQSANILIYKNGITIEYGITNEKGEFFFNKEYDSLIVNSIGYEEKKYNKTNNSDIIVFLNEKTSVLKEVIVNSKNKIILGEYQKKSSETRLITETEQFAMFFKSKSIKKSKIESIFLNLKKVPCKADLVFNFYAVDSIKRTYLNQNKKTKSILTEIIPDTKNNLASLQYKLNLNPNKEILEINLDSLNLKLPEKGIFVSLYVKNIYDDERKKKSSSYEQLPVIYKRKTKENNYCEKIQNMENYWRNINLVMRHHEETDEFHPLFPMTYFEPSIGLKILEEAE